MSQAIQTILVSDCGPPAVRPQVCQGYDFARCRKPLRKHDLKSCIVRRGIKPSEWLERHRWVVERTLSWLNRYRRLKVRYERRADIHQAFPDFGCAGLLELHAALF